MQLYVATGNLGAGVLDALTHLVLCKEPIMQQNLVLCKNIAAGTHRVRTCSRARPFSHTLNRRFKEPTLQ